jgi:hypothetical protein
MSNVQFEENEYDAPRKPPKQYGGVVGLIFKFGLAKNQKQANVVLVIIGIVVILLTIWLWPSTPSYDENSGNTELVQ